jgi:two-component system chemotaxis sensor kinase CheA
MKDPLQSLRETFFLESNEILSALEELLIELDNNPENKELLHDIFRKVHTLKGSSGMLEEFYSIEALAHAQEDLLDPLREGEFRLSRDMIDLFFQTLDLFKKLLNDTSEEKGRGEVPPSLQAEYQQILEKLKALVPNSGSEVLGPESEVLDSNVGLQTLDSEFKTPDSESKTPNSGPRTPDPNDEEAFWGKLKALQEETTDQPTPQREDYSINFLKPSLDVIESKEVVIESKKPGEVLRVSPEKLDQLLNLVGELVISYTLINQNSLVVGISDPQLQKDLSHLGKIIRDLQDQVMSVRMVSLAQTFQKIKRVTWDAARKTGKDVVLEISGGDTELDKTVMEQIGDPLVHLIRNAVDHGIELPEERNRAGKPPYGTIWLQAQHQRGNIVIEVRDDGKGISREKVLQKARERDLISEETHLTDREVLDLIMLPGFSTAQEVSSLSGRGVGLDVVKKKVQDLRGKLDIQSIEGKGTTMTITLPLTLAIIDGMVIKVGQQRYILPLTFIERILRPQVENFFTIQGKGEVIMVEEDPIPIIRLYEIWNVQPEKKNLWEGLMVIVGDGKRKGGLFVDDLLEQQQVVIKELGDLKGLKGISGGTILGNGTVGLILDVAGILEMAFQA